MEYTTIQKNITTPPRKLRLVADMIRKMTPARALETLEFTNKAAAKSLAKAIKTVLANAGKDNVVFKTVEINEGMKLKRNRIGTAGRGRSRPYRRRWSHIKIILTDNLEVKSQKEKVKNAIIRPLRKQNLRGEKGKEEEVKDQQ